MLLFMDSFDAWTTTSHKGYEVVGGGSNGATGARTGARAYNSTANSHNARKTLTFGTDTGIAGFAFMGSAWPGSGTQSLFSFMDVTGASGTRQFSIGVNASRQLVAHRGSSVGGTLLGTSTSAFSSSISYHIQVKVLIHASAGTVDVLVNGVSWLTLTGVNTRGAAATTLGGIWIGQASTGDSCTFNFDDLYVCDTAGAANNDFLGDRKVVALLPSGAGSSTQFTPSAGSNFQNVDESAPDDDTTYNSSSTIGHKDLYAMGDLASTAGTISGVMTSFRARKDDAGTRTLKSKIKSGATEGNGTDRNLSTSYVTYNDMFEQNPDTSAPWTGSGVNGMEAGVEVVA